MIEPIFNKVGSCYFTEYKLYRKCLMSKFSKILVLACRKIFPLFKSDFTWNEFNFYGFSLSLVLEAITFIPRGFNLHFRKNYSSHYNHHRTSYICVPTRPLNHTSSNPWTIVQGMLEKTVRTREKLRMQLNIRNAILKHFLDLRNLLKTKTRESWNLENIEGLEVFYDLSRSRWAKTMPVSFS